MKNLCAIYILILALTASGAAFAADFDEPPIYSFEVINEYPHDNSAFTQGLAFKDGFFIEGIGRRGYSELRQLEIKTGKVLRSRKLDNRYFGEGVAVFNGKIAQLTETSKTGFVYDAYDFTVLRRFRYPTNGWGITWDGENLIMSDGSSALYFIEPVMFNEVKRINVHVGDKPVVKINELEFVEGKIYANIWKEERIAVISPQTGKVEAWIDLSGILSDKDKENIGISVLGIDPKSAMDHATLNGIAYDPENRRLFVTGKLWPKVFEIETVRNQARH